VKVSSVRWGIIWIGIGLLFLAINLELLDTLVFPRLFSLWPILLIAIGVELMFRRTRLYFLAFLSPLLIAAAFIFAAYAQGDWGWNADEFWRRWVWQAEGKKTNEVEIPSDSTIAALELDLQLGSSEVLLRPTSDRLFAVTTEYYRRSPWVEHTRVGDIEKIEYVNRERTRLAIFGFNVAASRNEIYIADYIPVTASVSALEQESNLDFSRLRLTKLDLNIRSDRTQIIIGEMTDTLFMTISGKTDELDIYIPTDYGLIIRGDSLMLDRLLDGSSLSPAADGFHSGNYAKNPKNISVQLDAKIGMVSLDGVASKHAGKLAE
jgi:hypothetical protein